MKIELDNTIKQNIYFQLFFWPALFLFAVVRNYGEYDPSEFTDVVIYNFCHWIFQIIGANFMYYILFRRFFDRKKYFKFSLYLLLSLYIISVINRIFIVYAAEPFFISLPKDNLLSIFTDINYLLSHYTFPVISSTFVFISIMFFVRYKDEKQQTMKLLKEKTELELKSLKSQLNPHFLFNTLNNIYSLSLSSSEKTSESIGRLSDILDYILYKGQKKWVSIADELTIINDYIALESLRYNERLRISRNTELDFSNTIPPLLYLTLVENAFKHGAGKTMYDVEIKIAVKTTKEYSFFRIENTCESTYNNKNTGIGIQNIERQLRHHYHDNFSFFISQEKNTFIVEINTPAAYD
ncbi:two-component system sensor histidine kinase AlgZ [Chryseobacterium sp. H1D6B]|uniref:sensor histidine kinase n=1 Tax=Chryseobacterium sp. H1D6B TaxID=2940588 RepID=UPI0015CB4C3B|nr:sensor histidine kinase [Chryseobacterium sp. H1D6B]MDH6254391.1 two-component system sensor histidine kinase AlgZ [Chryseobacterium sp. H1D6B]